MGANALELNPFDSGLIEGFDGLVAFSVLRTGGMKDIPGNETRTCAYGVYAIVRRSGDHPVFLAQATCCDKYGPPFSIEDLRRRWVEGSKILYLGKAGGPGIRETLRDRIQKYSSFGLGKRSSHGGGRAIWQVPGAEALIVCWTPTPGQIPLEVERSLRARFVEHYRRLPFANGQK